MEGCRRTFGCGERKSIVGGEAEGVSGSAVEGSGKMPRPVTIGEKRESETDITRNHQTPGAVFFLFLRLRLVFPARLRFPPTFCLSFEELGLLSFLLA